MNIANIIRKWKQGTRCTRSERKNDRKTGKETQAKYRIEKEKKKEQQKKKRGRGGLNHLSFTQ
jgi:hypothetical protein